LVTSRSASGRVSYAASWIVHVPRVAAAASDGAVSVFSLAAGAGGGAADFALLAFLAAGLAVDLAADFAADDAGGDARSSLVTASVGVGFARTSADVEVVAFAVGAFAFGFVGLDDPAVGGAALVVTTGASPGAALDVALNVPPGVALGASETGAETEAVGADACVVAPLGTTLGADLALATDVAPLVAAGVAGAAGHRPP
jgi:hypothetical protein